MASTIEKIKQLREETAAGMMDVKRALEESEGDVEGARKVLRERARLWPQRRAGGLRPRGSSKLTCTSTGESASLSRSTARRISWRAPEFKEFARNVALRGLYAADVRLA